MKMDLCELFKQEKMGNNEPDLLKCDTCVVSTLLTVL